MLPKISIVTPSFNQAQFIEQTIDSVLSQDYPHLEYIIIDGGSTDKTTEIIKKYEKHLTFWVSESDRGQSHAINKGLAQCTGEVFNWLNSDDYYAYDTLSLVGNAFMDTGTQVFCGRSMIFDIHGDVGASKGTDVYENNLTKTLGRARIDQPETFFRKSSIDALGGVNEHLHYIMDMEFWMRYLIRYGIAGIKKTNELLVNFRLHPNSKTVSTHSKFAEERNAVFLALAKNSGLSEEADFIHTHITNHVAPTQISGPSDLILPSLHNFYLLLADEAYVKDNFKLSKAILKHINAGYLIDEDLTTLNKLKFRTQLPAGIVNLFRK